MPNIKSAIKRVRIAEKKTLNNNILKSEYKTAVRKFEKANEEGKKEAIELLSAAKKAINHASSKHVISKNAASRKVSRLEKKLSVKAEAKKAPAKKVEKKVEEAPVEKKATAAKKTTSS